MKILIIDNFKEDRELLVKYLLEEKDSKKIKIDIIDESDCLTSALEKIENNEYDTILMDLILPEVIGIGNIIAIKNTMEQLKKIIPIIVITAYENYSEGRKAYKLGIKDYLIKTEIFPKDIARSIKFAIQPYKKI